tara:strand:+ start:59 stop:649 length:591 start_codon:yes stop_codon:yes gene_type:complete
MRATAFKLIAVPVSIICALIAIIIALRSMGPTNETNTFDMTVSSTGAISLPEIDFRKNWTVLGTWSVNDEEKQGAKGFHTVYAESSSVDYFRKHKKFPDRAVIIKELRNAKTTPLSTGTVSWPTDLSGWFVLVKDTKKRFPQNRLWGNGWGWAFFTADNTNTTITKDYKAECIGCHIPAKKDDWLYLRAYPVLKSK